MLNKYTLVFYIYNSMSAYLRLVVSCRFTRRSSGRRKKILEKSKKSKRYCQNNIYAGI